MTPEDEEAHLAALLAGDDSGSDKTDAKQVKVEGEAFGESDDEDSKGAKAVKGESDPEVAVEGDEERKATADDTAGKEGGQVPVKEEDASDKGDAGKRASLDMAAEKSDGANVSTPKAPAIAIPDASDTVYPIITPSTPETRHIAPEPAALAPRTPERPPRRSVEQPSISNAEVEELRESLASAQRTVSTQAARLGDLEEMHQRLSEQHKFLSAAKEAVETRLRDEVSKREAAEEAAEALRGQVEVARRGVMTLQKQEKERKRASMMGMPAGGVPGIGLGLDDVGEESEVLKEEGTSRQNKRSSTLLRGRRSSQTEADLQPHISPNATPGSVAGLPTSSMSPPSAPPRSGLRELRLGASTAQLSPKLGSGAVVSSPSSQSAHMEDPYSSSARDRAVSGTSVDQSLVTELENVRGELLAAQVRLSESEEARQASEDCLKALREFITGSTSPAENAEQASPGIVDLNDPAALMALKGIRLPPLPTDKEPDEPAPSVPEKKGWGFKMPVWKGAPVPGQNPASSSSQAAEPATPRSGMSPPPSVRSSSYASHEEPQTGVASTPLASFVSSWTRGVTPATPAAIDTAAADVPAAQATPRGFGGFFRRTNTSTAKELPARPASVNEDADEVGSVGAEKGDDMDKNRMPAMSREGSNSGRMDLESRLKSQLQPSPEIKLGKLEGEEEFKPSASTDAELSLGSIDSDAVLKTPNMPGLEKKD